MRRMSEDNFLVIDFSSMSKYVEPSGSSDQASIPESLYLTVKNGIELGKLIIVKNFKYDSVVSQQALLVNGIALTQFQVGDYSYIVIQGEAGMLQLAVAPDNAHEGKYIA